MWSRNSLLGERSAWSWDGLGARLVPTGPRLGCRFCFTADPNENKSLQMEMLTCHFELDPIVLTRWRLFPHILRLGYLGYACYSIIKCFQQVEIIYFIAFLLTSMPLVMRRLKFEKRINSTFQIVFMSLTEIISIFAILFAAWTK